LKYNYEEIGNGWGLKTRNIINQNLKNIESDMKEVSGRVDNIVTEGGNSNLEIVDARGTYTTLKERLDDTQSDLQAEADKIGTLQTSINDNTSQLAKMANKMEWVDVKDFGVVGDGTDETTKLLNAFTYALQNNIPVQLGVKKEYNITNQMKLELTTGKKLSIKGNGSTIKFTGSGVTGIQSMLEITDNSTTNLTSTIIEVDELTFDGIGVPEQWDVTVYANLKQLWGLTLRADTIRLNNVQFKNLYGYGIKIRGYQNIIIDGVKAENVGGCWYTNDTYDAFGDAIYVGGGKQTTNETTINNVHVVGYPSDRVRKSRIGIAFEKDVEIVNIKNIYIEGYNRSIHIENCPNIIFNGISLQTRRSDVHTYIHTGYKTFSIDSWDAECTSGGAYGGRSGLIAFDTITDSPRSCKIKNGKIKIINDVATNFLSEKVVFENTEIINNGGRQQISGGDIILRGGRVEGKALRIFAGLLETHGCNTEGKDTNPVIEVEYSSSKGRLLWNGGIMKDSRIHLINVPYAMFNNFTAIETKNYQYSATCVFISDFASKAFVKNGTLKTTTNDASKFAFADSRTVYTGDSYKVLIDNTVTKVASNVV